MKLNSTIDSFNMLSEGDYVLCALSGGADSVAMTHWMAQNATRLRIKVAAAHFSHGIRKDKAEEERALCLNLCNELGIDFYYGEGDSIVYSKENKLGLEESARNLRYMFLDRIADQYGANKIATAHHADDNIETIIMNARRGAGIAGLVGVPPIRDRFIRPLIETTKKDVLKYIDENQLTYANDLTNFEPCCERNRLRLLVLPEIRDKYPSFDEIITRISRQATIYNDRIKCKAIKLAKHCDETENTIKIPISIMREAENVVESSMIQLMHKRVGGKSMLSSRHIDSVRRIIDGDSPSARVYLPEVMVKREYENLVFSSSELNREEKPKIIKIGQKVKFGLWETEIVSGKCPSALWIDSSKICGDLVLRSRREGEQIYIGGHHKSLKKLMIDKKIPKDHRDSYPVLSDGDNIVAVAGIGKDMNYNAESCDNVISVIFRRIEE